MLTKGEVQLAVDAIIAAVAAVRRSKAKSKYPEFAAVYEKHEAALAALAMKVRTLEDKK